MDWNAQVPGCHNFAWWEFFVTSHNQALLRQEFLALPTGEQQRIRQNIIILANRLQMVRDLYNAPVTITSGYRSRRVNDAVGGARNSYHLSGMAADILVAGVSPAVVQQRLANWAGGLGLNPDFTHLDIRPVRSRFTY